MAKAAGNYSSLAPWGHPKAPYGSFAGKGAPPAVAEPVRAPDGGAGERRVVDPWEIYGRPKERLKVEEKRDRIKVARETLPDLPELSSLARQVGTLSAQATRFEARVEKAREEEIDAIAEQYRRLVDREQQVEELLIAVEAQIAHHIRLMTEDDEFLLLLKEIL